jgi:DNA repair protein RecO (recombination protein O)
MAMDLERFLAGSAVAELVLRLAGGEANAILYKVVSETLDALASASSIEVAAHALGGGWRILAAAGFAPSLDQCASCHASLSQSTPLSFSPSAGGGVCDRCARMAPASRRLPSVALSALQAWLKGEIFEALSPAEVRAHQRLLREFLTEHFPDDKPLRAFSVWESGFATAPAVGALYVAR